MSSESRERKRTRAKTPRRWSRRRVPRRWRTRLAPAPDALQRPPKGSITFWARARRLLWAWWIWSAAFLVATAYNEWVWALSFAVLAVFAYLAAPQEFPPRYGLDHQFAVTDDEFLPTIAGTTGAPFVGGNRIEILNNGDEFYPEMLAALQRAEQSVTIEAYIYWAGHIGLTFARALAERARAGIKVKILLDAVGSAAIGEEILKILEDGGCQLAWYNPVRWYSLARLNNRTHRKSLIVDGRIGFTGGAGIADVWVGRAQDPEHWRDMQIRLEGPAVVPLQTGFAQNWLEATQELISGPLYYPHPNPVGSVHVQTIMSSPETGASAVRIMYYLSIICARRSIYIANPYFIPDAVAIASLTDAARRGVDVQIMVAGVHNDNWWARRNSQRLYGKLLQAGVKIFEYNHTMLHHKTMMVDDVWITVGTTNFDSRSFALNEESNICVMDVVLAAQLRAVFQEDAERCQRVDLASWRNRGLFMRLQEVVAALLQDQA